MSQLIISFSAVFLLILSLLGAEAQQRKLRVSIFPWIPDLAYDKLQMLISWIETTFEKENPEIDLNVSAAHFDVYDLDDLKNNLTDDPFALHIVEIGTIFLGEIVHAGLIAQIFPENYGLNVNGFYLPSTLEAVQYNGNFYAVPTLICGNFLMGINIGNITERCLVQDGVTGYANLSNRLNQCKQDLLIERRSLTLAGNFKGSWTLPNAYIDAYIDHHGANAVYAAINSDIGAETDVIAALSSFIEYCQESSNNRCFDDTFKNTTTLVEAIVGNGETITGYGYSELSGSFLQYAMNKGIDINVYDVIAPPLGPANNFLMYTDAMVINKALVNTDSQEDVDSFINFYSKLTTRLSIAFGDDLPMQHPPRYLMQARMDFYNAPRVTDDMIYNILRATPQYAVAAPNNGLYNNRKNMKDEIQLALDLEVDPPRSYNQFKSGRRLEEL